MKSTTATPARPDAEIFAEARHALDRRPAVPAGIRVHVDRGRATLTGTVRRPFERSEAEEAVRAVPGVRRLVNEIVVSQFVSAEGFEPPEQDVPAGGITSRRPAPSRRRASTRGPRSSWHR